MMNFGQPGMQLPKNFNNPTMQNGGYGSSQNLPNGISNPIANKVGQVKQPERVFKALDGTTWSSFEAAKKHSQRYLNETGAFGRNNF